MKRRKNSNALINNMNVVPYIDVMLVLLIIFMVTAPMFVPGVINLPSVGKSSQLTVEPIEISITKDGSYALTRNKHTTEIPNLDQLVTNLQANTTLDTPVVISADKETKYDNVIKVVDRLYSSGIKKVALVVKDKNG